MHRESLLLAAVLVPVLGSVLLPLVGAGTPRLRNLLALAMVCTPLACSLALIPSALAGQTLKWSLPASWSGVLGLDFLLVGDGMAVFVACVSSFISAVIVLYSFDYISHYAHQNEYYFMVVLFLGSMMGLVYAGNLILLYIFWELTAITSWRLIGFFREPQHVVRADKAFLVTAFGALAMLLGFISIYSQTGSFDLSIIRAKLGGGGIPDLAVVLILLGILSKSATLPFHTWLPDAGVAPSPVTALLHAAVLVKIGVYVFARLFVVTFPLSPDWQTNVMAVAAASALVSAGAAMIETDLKRIIAYSTVSQIGFIFLGFASGSELGVAGALLYILMHGLAKGGLFLCAGIVEQRTHTKDVRQMGGLIRTMPVTAVAFLLCAFSVMGVPPLGGFFTKYMVMSGSVQAGHWGMALTFMVGAFLTLIYLLRVFRLVFLGEPKSAAKEGSPLMVGCVAALALLSLAGGVFISPPSALVLAAVQHISGFAK